MSFNILMNSSNVIGNYNTNFLYRFIQGSFVIYEGAEICVSQIIMPYSFFNLNKGLYNNTNFQFKFGGSTTYSLIIPNGFYSTNDIQQYLQTYCLNNNLYAIDSATGLYVFFIYLYTNQTYYANQFILSLIPINSADALTLYPTYTFPTGFPFTNTARYTPQIIFPSIGGLNSILGFIAGTYPSTLQTTQQSILSNITPNATPVNSITIKCNLVNNTCSSPTDILDTFSIQGTAFGSNIVYTPSYEKWIKISSGTYADMLITFLDQNLNTIQSNDPNVLINLLIRQGKKPELKFLQQIKERKIKSIEFKDDLEE